MKFMYQLTQNIKSEKETQNKFQLSKIFVEVNTKWGIKI